MDFGLLTIISETTNLSVPSSSFIQGGTYPWMSPELFAPDKFGLEHSRRTKHSDCYALGMVIYEVLSGKVPFDRYGIYAIVTKVVEGERPKRPRGSSGMWFTGEVWSVLEHCWKPNPGDRPGVPEILRSLKRWTPPSPRSLTLADPVTPIGNFETTDGSKVSSSSRVSPSWPPWALSSQGNEWHNACISLSLTHF